MIWNDQPDTPKWKVFCAIEAHYRNQGQILEQEPNASIRIAHYVNTTPCEDCDTVYHKVGFSCEDLNLNLVNLQHKNSWDIYHVENFKPAMHLVYWNWFMKSVRVSVLIYLQYCIIVCLYKLTRVSKFVSGKYKLYTWDISPKSPLH